MCNTLPKTARHIRLGSSMLLLLALVLATLSLPTRTHAQDDEQCFLETGYCIAGRIQEFWQHNGGLAVFGYPISPQQPAVREGKTYQVQWFQRHRLELHPDNAPPYDVLIGHLGKDVLADQTRPWATTFPATDPLPNCRYFAETGHNICGDMLQAWQTHGLDLDGQPTTSEQESLALFGMPISEAHTETLDDGQDYTVQWFERARLELHPENIPPYHVLFGLLGEMMYTPTPDTTHTTALPPAFMREQTRFAFTFFTTLRQAQGNTNMFISPTSLAYALAMTYNGADGATQQAMAQALHVQGMGIPAVNEAFAALMQATQQADPDVTLTIANALWAREGLSFAPDFLQRNQQYYHAEVDVLDFDDPGAVATINGWVSKQTHGKIPSIVDELKPETIMVLINAIYFKGGWTEPFDEDETTDLPFTLLDGTTKEVPMMTQFDSYRYYAGEDFQAVSLPYGKERIMMTIFLPSEATTLPAWLQQLDATTWRQWLDNMSEEDGSVRLPRFKLEDDHSLEDTLTHMGMGLAFDCTQADFSRMYAMPNVCISSVRQKTFVEVNEEGTEAAAVTSVEMELTSAMPMPTEPFTMIVDRPFFFAIHDGETGAILFMGMIVEP